MQFNESKIRSFEIKNEGIFEFNYRIFDYNNEEHKKEVQDAYFFNFNLKKIIIFPFFINI